MVGYPTDVEEIYFGDTGIFQTLSAGKVVVDMTTSTPTLAVKIAKQAAQIGATASMHQFLAVTLALKRRP